jgi:nifR3 family TIM-barrel protein
LDKIFLLYLQYLTVSVIQFAMHNKSFSPELQSKIDSLSAQAKQTKLGDITFDSQLLLAPMAGICTPPFRLLMEDLGAGGTVSELISCHGINYENKKTLDMLKIDEREKNVGIQLFGEDGDAMARAAKIAVRSNPKFIDINMGCPVRKVVTKGGGSALMRDIDQLSYFFNKVKSAIDIPLSIKIRTGWDADEINADKIERIAKNEGIEWIAVHGRTRAQQYTGKANWEYIEWLKQNTTLPLIGNGDLHQPHQVSQRLKNTDCDALMIARGCLRNPFIFLESFAQNDETKNSLFKGSDYWEVIERFYQYVCDTYENDRFRLVQLRKLVVWFAAGFPRSAKFRNTMFSCQDLEESMNHAQDFYMNLGDSHKKINFDEIFMSSGHG